MFEWFWSRCARSIFISLSLSFTLNSFWSRPLGSPWGKSCRPCSSDSWPSHSDLNFWFLNRCSTESCEAKTDSRLRDSLLSRTRNSIFRWYSCTPWFDCLWWWMSDADAASSCSHSASEWCDWNLWNSFDPLNTCCSPDCVAALCPSRSLDTPAWSWSFKGSDLSVFRFLMGLASSKFRYLASHCPFLFH